MRSFLLLCLLLILWIVPAQAAEEQVITGTLTSLTDSAEISIYALEGEFLMAVTQNVSDTLDPALTLYNAETGEELLSNDDYGWYTLQAALIYQVPQDATYSLVVSSAGWQSMGDFSLRLTSGGEELLDNILERVEFSGPALRRETEHFVVHYTLEGADATSEDYVDMVAEALETVWTAQIDEQGWLPPPPDHFGGDSRYDVYLANIKEFDPLTSGLTVPDLFLGDNPQTLFEETDSATSYIMLENDLAERGFEEGERQDYMLATITHEFNHASQMAYDSYELTDWYYEATATWVEMQAHGNDGLGWDLIPNVFYTPEICLGASFAYDVGGLDYGGWLALQTITDRVGPQFMVELWENIARYNGLSALEATLNDYDSSLPEAMAHFHVRTLARDFDMPEDFEDVVWTANTITSDGDWLPRDSGVEELGANFFYLKRGPGRYTIELEGDGNVLELWSLAVRDDEILVTSLGRGGTVDTAGMDYVYLMVFNPLFRAESSDCEFATYSLAVGPGNDAAPAPAYSLDASQFLPLAID